MENLSLLILFLVLTLILFTLLSAKNNKFKETRTNSILYTLITGLIIGAGGLFAWKNLLFISDSKLFYILIVWMLGIGILHVYLSDKILPWSATTDFWSSLIFTICNALFGGFILLLAFHFVNHKDYTTFHLVSLLMLILPFLFYFTFLQYMNIPVKIFKQWHYPVDKHIEDPQDREMESPFVIAFDFKKKANDEHMTSFRAKAPKDMVFGKLFYYFINDYNDRNPDEAIEYLENEKKPSGWIFYFKPKWFNKIRYIDPEETNSLNLIKENSVIVCKRVVML